MFNVVVGTRRSGTSLLMLCLRQAGIPIIGFKYTIFLKEKNGEIIIQTIPSNELRKHNPNGYWEVGTITTKTGIKKEHLDLGMKGDVLKITADAYYFSDLEMIDKTILILRNPRNVLTSMIKGQIFKEEDINEAIQKNIRDLKRTLDTLQEHIIIHYEDLLNYPVGEMERVCSFLNKGNAIQGAKVVDKKLNRSTPYQGNPNGLKEWEELTKIT